MNWKDYSNAMRALGVIEGVVNSSELSPVAADMISTAVCKLEGVLSDNMPKAPLPEAAPGEDPAQPEGWVPFTGAGPEKPGFYHVWLDRETACDQVGFWTGTKWTGPFGHDTPVQWWRPLPPPPEE